eukprot:g5014.t1
MDTVINVIGFSAGLLVAASLLPQIWRAHKRKSAEDLSFLWQGTVATGVSLQLIYLYHYGMWAVFYPLFSELVFILYLAGLKLYYEHHLLGLGRGDRPFVNRKTVGLSTSDDYTVLGVSGGGGGSGGETSLESSGAGAGRGAGAAVAGEEGDAASDSRLQEVEGGEKRRLASSGIEGESESQAL